MGTVMSKARRPAVGNTVSPLLLRVPDSVNPLREPRAGASRLDVVDQRGDQRERDPKLCSPLQKFIAAIIVPALVNRWHREQNGRSAARDTASDQKPVAVSDTSALP